MKELVLVTGANGYIAGMLIKALLEQGYKVRGTVRDVTNESKTAALKALPNASMNLELVSLELAGPQEPFDDAMKDVEWVMHTASPLNLQKVKDDNELIRPAVEGTLSMLRAAHKTPKVKKFVMTSSLAAIYSGHAGQDTFTEDDWSNLVDGSYVSAYDKSKTKAEKAAWEFMDNHDTKFTLSAINPSVVLGPVVSGNVNLHGSPQVLSRIMEGTDPGVVDMFWSFVDVRDVVQAHIQAAKIPEAAGKRFLLAQSDGGELSMPEIAAILKDEFNPMGYKVRTNAIPKWLLWIMSWFDADLAGIFPLIGVRYHCDNSRSREILKLDYIPAKRTLIEGTYSMIEHGIIEKKPGYKKPEKVY